MRVSESGVSISVVGVIVMLQYHYVAIPLFCAFSLFDLNVFQMRVGVAVRE